MNTANPPVEAMAALLGTDTISKGRELTFKVDALERWRASSRSKEVPCDAIMRLAAGATELATT
jgi:hypothetical protein